MWVDILTLSSRFELKDQDCLESEELHSWWRSGLFLPGSFDCSRTRIQRVMVWCVPLLCPHWNSQSKDLNQSLFVEYPQYNSKVQFRANFGCYRKGIKFKLWSFLGSQGIVPDLCCQHFN